MKLSVEQTIEAPKTKVWELISNIENSPNVISAIENVEVLEKPAEGLKGFKWKEQRTLFGKTATEIMWITDAVENESYSTRAESHGSVYVTKLQITEQDGTSNLKMEFIGEPQTFGAKLMAGTLGFLFKKATIKALEKDLIDIKLKAEQKN